MGGDYLDGGVSLVDAARRGDVRAVKELLDAGCGVDAYEGHENPLTISAWLGNTDVVRLLLARGARVNVIEGTGSTPEKLARNADHNEIVEMLREAEKGRRPSPPDLKPSPPPEPPRTVESWEPMGTATVAKVGTYPALGKKLTSVFNFETRNLFVIADDLGTRAQSVTPISSFDELPKAALSKAFDEFTRLGGKADKDYVLHGMDELDKQRPPIALKS